MRIQSVSGAPAAGTFTNDDQAAILAGASRDGYFYRGTAITRGYGEIRQPSESLLILLGLEDGHTVLGAGVSVQYAGGSGREPLLRAADALDRWQGELRRVLEGHRAEDFRAGCARLGGLGLPKSVEYGVTQALLAAAAYARRITMAEVIAAEWSTGVEIAPVPILAQSGEDRRGAVDRMVLRRVDSLPHGLINAPDLVGADGAVLLEYVTWVRNRIRQNTGSDYAPVLHFDLYGTLNQVFGTLARCADYLCELEAVAAPYRLRIEQPVSAGSRAAQIDAMAELRELLARAGSRVQLVADEWCNTLDDVHAFIAAGAADVVQIKLPDVGGIDAIVESILACRAAGVAAYCGGSCTETDLSARVATQVAMGTAADVLLARPGMGVDEAVMVTRNEMTAVLATIGNRSPR
ncbi:methylaspartate ammonia-lyase [Kribbella sp. NPDC048928]|uniref:methylaspartate ammonia-lyase n=1 Tax=Kribbella sp. NPDC048928 TaxID=3364111 RepID=UPI00370F9978